MSLRSGAEMPSLDGATHWIGGEVTPETLLGRPAVVQFWAVSCAICKENMPQIRRWKETYGKRGVQFVAVHMPRGLPDTDLTAVQAAAQEYGIDEPIAVDNAHAIGERFQTGGIWPHYFLFDAGGKLRCRAGGYAGLRMIEAALARLAGTEPEE
jgi:thiol-disulfide isomerase/thioredoxin